VILGSLVSGVRALLLSMALLSTLCTYMPSMYLELPGMALSVGTLWRCLGDTGSWESSGGIPILTLGLGCAVGFWLLKKRLHVLVQHPRDVVGEAFAITLIDRPKAQVRPTLTELPSAMIAPRHGRSRILPAR